MRVLLTVSACLTLASGCASEDDPTFYLTGSEELAVRSADGEYVCESPRKVLICHLPPGNPENAQTICVGAPAVVAHEEHHGDPVGACDDGEEGDGEDGDGDDGDGDGGDGEGEDGDDGDGDGEGGDGGDGGETPPVD